jgi:hypothetical protein
MFDAGQIPDKKPLKSQLEKPTSNLEKFRAL